MPRPLLILLPLLLLPAGCGAPQQDTQFELRKTQSERDRLKLALDTESAKSQAISQEYTRASAKWDGERAELSALRQRVAELDRTNHELNTLLDKRAAQPMTRPAVPATPLPGSLDERLTSYALQHAARVSYDRGRAAVSFSNDKLFDPGSDVVKRDALDAFNELATIANREDAREWDIVVVGHTDDSAIKGQATLARHPSNWHLSAHRAISVMNVLVAAGLEERRVGVMGYGSMRPISAERPLNRRVEVYFVRRGEVRAFEALKP